MQQLQKSMLQQQQRLMSDVMLRMQQLENNVSRASSGPAAESTANGRGESTTGSAAETPRRVRGERAERLPTRNPAQWLATQIPEYGGTKEENVNVWIRRVDRVADIHAAIDGVSHCWRHQAN